MRVRVSESAKQDALGTEAWLDSEHPGFGRQFILRFDAALREIEQQPRFFARTDDGPDNVETREYFIERLHRGSSFGSYPNRWWKSSRSSTRIVGPDPGRDGCRTRVNCRVRDKSCRSTTGPA